MGVMGVIVMMGVIVVMVIASMAGLISPAFRIERRNDGFGLATEGAEQRLKCGVGQKPQPT